MYLAWSMTYFHINLDPRGKKKSFAANSYTRGYIVFLFFLLGFFFSLFLLNLLGFVFFLFWAGFSKTRLQGGAWEITLQFVALRVPPLGFGVQAYVGQLNHLLGVGFRLLLPVHCFFFVVFFFFRCSVLTRVLFQNTCVECVSLCAQEHTPL